jgi:hypothetical protein
MNQRLYAGHKEGKWPTNGQQPQVQVAAANDEQEVGDAVLEAAVEAQPEEAAAHSYVLEG